MLRPVQIRQHLNFMSSLGFEPPAVLYGTGISLERLLEPDYLVDVQACHRVVANILQLSGDPHIGMKIGSHTRLNDLGIVGYAMASSNSLEQAIGLWLQYGNSPVGFPFTLRLFSDTGSGWGITATSTGISGSVYRFYVEEILAMGMSFGGLLTGERFALQEVQFSFSAPDNLDHYQKQFNCPLLFNAPITKALVNHPPLSSPIVSNDSELRELCIRHCEQLVQRIDRHGPISFRLRHTLTTLGRVPSLDEAAAAMNLSSRSLRRFLQGEGTTFQRILDEFRRDLAEEYLGTGMMPAKEVAALLGYSHVEAFRRAFKTWTGKTVRNHGRGGLTTASPLNSSQGS